SPLPATLTPYTTLSRSPSAPFDLTIDTVAPGAPTLGLGIGGGITNDNTPTLSGTGEPGSTITVYVDGVAAGTDTVDNDGNWSIKLRRALDGGTYTITAS